MLTDDHRRWCPRRDEQLLWACRALPACPTAKLLEHAGRGAELETDPDPFALMVTAHQAALATRRDPAVRLARDGVQTHALYRKGWTRGDILSLYAFISLSSTTSVPTS